MVVGTAFVLVTVDVRPCLGEEAFRATTLGGLRLHASRRRVGTSDKLTVLSEFVHATRTVARLGHFRVRRHVAVVLVVVAATALEVILAGLTLLKDTVPIVSANASPAKWDNFDDATVTTDTHAHMRDSTVGAGVGTGVGNAVLTGQGPHLPPMRQLPLPAAELCSCAQLETDRTPYSLNSDFSSPVSLNSWSCVEPPLREKMWPWTSLSSTASHHTVWVSG